MANLERLIEQHSFVNDRHRAVISLLFIGNWISFQHQQFFKQFEITLQQFNILRILRGQYPQAASINLLRDRMLDRMSDVSRLVERLRSAELAERKLNDSDRRMVDVKITPKGLSLLKRIDEQIEETHRVMNGLSDSELRTLNELLDKMLANY